jgi:ATP-binding cassette subfamily F protein 3
VLSGGEKSRVMLGKLLLTPLNLLLLDEPSNHLDIEACDAFIEALDAFEGAVILVTHNEMFLHTLVNRLVVFKQGRIQVFEGGYQEFLDKNGWEETVAGASAPAPKTQGLSKKALRQKKSEIIADRSRVLKPIQKKIAGIEDAIEACENQIKIVNESLLTASQNGDGETIQTCSKELADLEATVEQLFSDLEMENDILESMNQPFENQLKELERQ